MSDTLLGRVAAGEAAAVNECLDRFGGLVWSVALRLLGDRAEAEDAVQEIFVDLWKSAGRYNPRLGSEATFVTVLARRRLIDRRRKSQRSPDVAPLPEAVAGACDAGDAVEVRDEAERAVRALRELRPEQQRVLELSIFSGLTHEEIAQETGLPLGTVKTHARRGLIRVRELLKPTTADAKEGRHEH